MIVFILRRLMMAIPVILGVIFDVVLIIRITPGDPAVILLGLGANPKSVEALRNELGLNQSIPIQFINYLKNVIISR